MRGVIVSELEKSRVRSERYRLRHTVPCQGGCGARIYKGGKRCKGCHRKVRVAEMPTRLRHGYARKGAVHPLHVIWRDMLGRCENPKNPRYPRYGARGIGVCKRWHTFEKWLEDVGPRPPGKHPSGRALYSIDREDNDGDYRPGNVRWVTSKQQAANSSRWAR